jgi:hypothetical protein
MLCMVRMIVVKDHRYTNQAEDSHEQEYLHFQEVVTLVGLDSVYTR